MINYWSEVTEEDVGYKLIIKANSDIIATLYAFETEEDAQLYAEAYINGYRDARRDMQLKND